MMPISDQEWEQMQQLAKQKHQEYEDLVDSIQNLSPLDKAEAWLQYFAKYTEADADLEALVYLVSRGYDCSQHIQRTATNWREWVNHKIENFRRAQYYDNFDTDEKTLFRKELSYVEASDIQNQPSTFLPNFWVGYDSQDLSIDATMLRTVEWCDIGGFEDWWQRLADDLYEATIYGGLDPVAGCYFLFNLCRSDYAIQLMHNSLIRDLEVLEFPENKQQYPWRRTNFRADPPQTVDHLAYAASVVFVNKRLRPMQSNSKLVEQAIETLMKRQDTAGGWPYLTDNEHISMEATAMAMHALALTKPRGWELALSAASDWLWSTQDRAGCWRDPGAPDAVYLTVLVLDAVELAKGGSRVTFNLATSDNHQVEQPLQDEEERSMNKIKALFLAANPWDTDVLNLDEQIRSITEKIRAATHRDLLDLRSVWAVRADDLLQSLNEHQPHIVHFSGHGSHTGEILVVDHNGKSKPISTAALKALFLTLKDNIKIVILDACYSRSQAEAIAEVIDCVIGMEGSISETAATVFTGSFYRAIGFGRSVQQAFDQGRTALLLEDIPENDIPKLLTRPGIDPSQVILVYPESS